MPHIKGAIEFDCDFDALAEDLERNGYVKVVRCCNCKWFQCNMSPDGQIPKGVDEYECRHWCGSCDPTDYCSWGVRRVET